MKCFVSSLLVTKVLWLLITRQKLRNCVPSLVPRVLSYSFPGATEGQRGVGRVGEDLGTRLEVAVFFSHTRREELWCRECVKSN